MNILIYVPAYNVEAHLVRTLARIPTSFLHRTAAILIVDNASTDGTAKLAQECRVRYGPKVRVIRNASNAGYGGSQKIAYRYAAEHGFDLVVMLHADGQYAPDLIESIVAPIERNEADMVFGSRLAGNPLEGNMPLHRYLGNKALTSIANWVMDWDLTEYHSGYRAYRVNALSAIPLHLDADYFHFDVEILAQFRAKRLRVVEVPIPTHYGDERSHLNIVRTGFAILAILLEYLLHRLRVKRSLKYETG